MHFKHCHLMHIFFVGFLHFPFVHYLQHWSRLQWIYFPVEIPWFYGKFMCKIFKRKFYSMVKKMPLQVCEKKIANKKQSKTKFQKLRSSFSLFALMFVFRAYFCIIQLSMSWILINFSLFLSYSLECIAENKSSRKNNSFHYMEMVS